MRADMLTNSMSKHISRVLTVGKQPNLLTVVAAGNEPNADSNQ